jgi:hypothetical protein
MKRQSNKGMDGTLMPRSIRWRIQLGLLQVPEDEASEQQNKASPSLSDLAKHNQERLALQRQEYDRLVEKHEIRRVLRHAVVMEDKDGFVVTDKKKESSPTLVANDDAVDPLFHTSSHNDDDNPLAQNGVAPSDKKKSSQLDPLTAMVMEQERQEKRLHDLDLKYRKERARRKFGISEGELRVIQDDHDADGGDRFDTYSVSRI